MLIENHPDRSRFTTIVEVTRSADFVDLNKPQRKFVLRYIGEGLATGIYDSISAAQHAYPKITKPQTRAYQLLRHPRIRRVIDAHFHRSETELILSDIRKLMGVLTRRLAAFQKSIGQEKSDA